MDNSQIVFDPQLVPEPDRLYNNYLNAKSDDQKNKALKEIEKVGGQRGINLALWLDSIDLKKRG